MNRTHMMSTVCFATALFITAVFAEALGPGTFDLSWNTIDGGGGKSTGGAFELQGTIGQPDASVTTMTGGAFSLAGGFWPGSGPSVNTCPADIAPLPSGNGIVNIDDLLLVINSWGACANPNNCPADIAPPPAGNDTVNIDDLLAVINAWGACP